MIEKSTTLSTVQSGSHKDHCDILVAVDGTCYKNDVHLPRDRKTGKVLTTKITGHVNSHVWNFYSAFETHHGHKYYHDGPSQRGFNTGTIIDHGLANAKKSLAVTLESRNRLITEETTTLAHLGIRIILVGHRRGGLIVMMIAHHLQEYQPHPRIYSAHVHFMGLYDAVDRHIGEGMMQLFGGAKIPGSVKEARHAHRDTTISSWKRGVIAFGNTGLEAEPGCHLVKTLFTATHSGMGRDPWGGDHPSQITKDIDINGSHEVGCWMLVEAKKCHLRFKDSR